MDMQEALNTLNVADSTLTTDEISKLDEQGYLPLYNVLTQEQVATFRDRLSELTITEGELAGTEVHQEAGTNRLSNLINKDPMFDICYTHPRVLAAMNHVLSSDFKLSSLNSRASLPGEGLQALHADWREAVNAGDYQVCNSIWLLVDFTRNNGATRVVPGTHRSGQRPSDVMDDPLAAHLDEVQLVAPAGTVVIFNSHMWHGGTVNHSESPRYALHSYFCRRHQPQQLDQKAHLSEETLSRLSQSKRYILDV
jgi:ectoine hydroxylase-related dioxygenase (phytanoyl-CoA dioxygenase family)